MVTQTLKTISNAEKKLEHAVNASMDNNSQDASEQAAREMKKIAEMATFSAIEATENWGKQALNKTKDLTEDICL